MNALAKCWRAYGNDARTVRRRRVLHAWIAVVLALVVLSLCANAPSPAWGASHKADPATGTKTFRIVNDEMSNRWDYDGSGISTRLRWLESQDGGNLVYCINPGVNEGPGEGTISLPARLLAESDFKNKALYRACLAALYYAPGGPGYKTEDGSTLGRSLFPDTDWRGGSFGYRDRFATAHCLMGFYYNGADWDDTYPQSNRQPAAAYRSWFMKNMVPTRYGGTGSDSYGERTLAHFNDEDMLANGGYTVEAWEESVYLVMTGDADKQDLLTYVDIPRGPLRIQKQSAAPAISQDNPCYSLKGAIYTVYSDAACAMEVGTITVDSTGAGTLEGLVAGTYYVKETKAGTGFLPDTTTHEVKVKADTGGSFTSKEPPRHLPLDVLVGKVDAVTGKDTAQGAASLAEACFTVNFYAGYYDTQAALPATPTKTWENVKTGEDGRALKDIDLPLGTYTVRETAAPRGYMVNEKLYIGQVVADDAAANGAKLKPVNYAANESIATCNAPIVPDNPKTCGFRLSKTDSLMAGAQPEGDASLDGAVFSVVNDSEHSVRIDGIDYEKGQECLVVSTEKDGNAYIAQCSGDTLPYGDYTIREKEPPTGYLPNAEWNVSIHADDSLANGHIFDFTDSACEDQPICGGLAVPKIDRETARFAPLGEGTLEGAEFSIVLASEQPVKVGGSIFNTGDVVKIITVGSDGMAATGDHDLPYATYTVHETKAPVGYTLNTEWEARVQVRDDGRVYTTEAADDQVKRGDIRLNKAHGESMARMGRVAFLATSKTTGEHHVLVCDENGSLDTSASWIAHTQNTNANDRAVLVTGMQSAESKSGGENADGNDSDTPTESGEGRTESAPDDTDVAQADVESGDSAENAASEIDASAGEAPQDADPQEGGAGVGTSTAVEEEIPATRGAAEDEPTEADTTSEDDNNRGEKRDAAFDVDAIAHALAQALEADTVAIDNPDELAAMLGSATPGADVGFTATITKGDAIEKLSFIATVEEDGSLGIRDADTDDEIAYLDAGENADEPGEDPTGEGQGSQSSSSADSSSEGGDAPGSSNSSSAAGDNPSSADTSDSPATGTPDETPAATGIDIDEGKLDLEAGVWFSGRNDQSTEPNDSLGALPYDTYSFQELRSSANEGMSLVEFEVVVHRDSQNIDMGTIDNSPITLCTELTSPAGTHLAPAAGSITLTDAVSYTGLTPGKSYELRGYLVDKASGKTVGEASRVTFEPEKANGSVDVPLEIDTTTHAGKTLVAYQELFKGDTLITEHKDLDDADETIFIPKIETTLTTASGKKSAQAQSDTQLLDRVDYEGLLPGVEYTLKATLHVKNKDGSDGGALQDAAGKEVHAKLSFTPSTSRGSVSVPIAFDARAFSGKAVAFEELWYKGSLYAEHKDISDASQTVKLKHVKSKEEEPEPVQPEQPTPPQSTTPPETPSKGRAFEKTGDMLSQYWLLLALVATIGAGSGAYAALMRKPPYTSWG